LKINNKNGGNKMTLTKIILPFSVLFVGLISTIAHAQSTQLVHIKKRSNQAFAIDGGNGGANGQSVYLWGQNSNNTNQQWIEIDRGNNYYSYQKQGTDYCIDGGRGGELRQDVYLWKCSDNNKNQHWLKSSTGSGFVKLIKRNSPDFALNGGSGGFNSQNVNLFTSSKSSHNLQWSVETIGDVTNSDCISIDSLSELKDYLDQNNQCVKMAPGTYTFDSSNTGPNELFSDPSILKFTGENNTFIFDDVTFRFQTENMRAFGRADIRNFHVFGKNNSFRNLTMMDIGDNAPSFRAQAMLLDGVDNTVEGFDISTRGSFPYGYGDIFGKGGSSVIGHTKHSGILIVGESITLKDTRLLMRSYGHGIFMQGAIDTLIDGCHVEGELSTVNTVLAEEGTGSPADNVDFLTVWGFNLKDLGRDYRFSLQEDGIRAYPAGNPEGFPDGRDTGDITILNSTVKFMRSGVGVGLARSGKHYVENVTSLGNESGFWLGSDGVIVNSRGDTSVGPLITEDIRRGNTVGEITVLDYEVSKIGNTPSFYIAGTGHNYTINDGTSSVLSGITIQLGGARYGHRWYDGSNDQPLPNFAADQINIVNNTPYGLALEDNTSNTEGSSCGPIRRNNGTNNSVSRGRCN